MVKNSTRTAFAPVRTPIRRLADGSIAIGARPGGLSAQALQADGGEIVADVADIAATPPFVLLREPRRAAWWLSFVLGQDVAEEVAAMLDDPALDEASGDATPGDLSDAVLRLAKALWLYRRWPSPERSGTPVLSEDDERILEAEMGVLAWHAAELFGGLDLACDFLADNLELIEDLAVRSSATVPERAQALVRASIESVVLDQATLTRLQNIDALLGEALDAADEAATPATAGIVERARGWLRDRLEALAPTPATAYRGADDEQMVGSELRSFGGRVAVEFGRVPPRTLSALPDDHRWTVTWRDGDAPAESELAVRLTGGARPPWGRYVAAVHDGRSPLPQVLVPLTLSLDDDGSVVGTARIDRDVFEAETSRVRVFHEDFLAPGELGSPTLAREAEQVEVLRLVRALTAETGGDAAFKAAYDLPAGAPWQRWPGVDDVQD